MSKSANIDRVSNLPKMTRRELIKQVSALMGGVALVGSETLLALDWFNRDAASERVSQQFTPSDLALLDEVADTILPQTDTPGAKEAEVGAFIALIVTDAYYPEDKAVFMQGLESFKRQCHARFGNDFLAISPQQRLQLVSDLDVEQKSFMDSRTDDQPPHYFRMIKELTLLGYFTSEIGCKQAQRYVETPGRYDPCVDYQPGERAWARHS